MDRATEATGAQQRATPVTGSDLLAQALVEQKADTVFYLMGGPMLEAGSACIARGLKMIDVRHEQAAAMMAQAYARVLARPGVCMACSGPGSINLTTGLANALVDCVPVVALGGSSPVSQYGMGAFQEFDQLAVMRPVTKWAARVYEARRIPEFVDRAFAQALQGKPGPVYLDFPADVLHEQVDPGRVRWPSPAAPHFPARTGADPRMLDEAVRLLEGAERPLLLSGSGILWSDGAAELERFVGASGIPFYTTPQGRGVIPEDHVYFYGNARSTAFKEADVVLVVGTRLNYVFGFGKPPRFSPAAKFIRIDIDPGEVCGSGRDGLGILGDARTVLGQLRAAMAGRVVPARYSAWRERLAAIEAERAPKLEAKLANDQVPIHPLRLCRELRDFIARDAILVVDGQEILNFGRQAIPSYLPRHRLNSGPFGTMGVGLPFGLGAKAARPDKQVVVLHGDGSFGLNGMELDTAIRHKLPVLVVISLNGGWTADPERSKPGRDLGYTRFDRLAESLGCHGEYVERPEDIRPALERAGQAVAGGRTALVNVVTDWRAHAETVAFARAMT
jgi:thiamine pyrophosphate-dependent acetolactate synthase large subunit-like protein